MDGITSLSSVGAVASRYQASVAAASKAIAPQPTGDVASNALKLIHALLSGGTEAHVLDLKG